MKVVVLDKPLPSSLLLQSGTSRSGTGSATTFW
jgi:hypothetical protein